MAERRSRRRVSAVLGLTALFLVAASCGSDGDESALVERTEEFFAAVDAKPYDPAAVADFFDEGYVDLDRAATTPEEVSDVDGIQATYAELASAFPDGVHNLELVEAVGDDRVVAYWRFTGTHEGSLFGLPPTGRTVEISGVDIYRIVDDKMVEHRHVEDLLGLFAQLEG